MCCYCDVASENGFNTVFVKRMEGDFHFTVKPYAGPGDAPTGASSGLGGGFYFIVRVSFQLCALFKIVMHGYKS